MINRLNNGTHDNQAKVPTQTPQTHCKPNMIKFYKKNIIMDFSTKPVASKLHFFYICEDKNYMWD